MGYPPLHKQLMTRIQKRDGFEPLVGISVGEPAIELNGGE